MTYQDILNEAKEDIDRLDAELIRLEHLEQEDNTLTKLTLQ